jgi:hypothetical protein
VGGRCGTHEEKSLRETKPKKKKQSYVEKTLVGQTGDEIKSQ